MSIPKVGYKEIKTLIHDMQKRADTKRKVDVEHFTTFQKAIGNLEHQGERKKLFGKLQKLAKQGIGQSLARIEKKSNKNKRLQIERLQLLGESILVIKKEKTRENFQKRLQAVAEKELVFPGNQQIASNTQLYESVFADDNRPLVGQKIPMKDLANEYKQGVEKHGLERLDAFFKMRRVAGDGHCLFRATFASLLYFLKTAPDDVKQVVSSQLERSVKDLQDVNPSLEARYKEVIEAIDTQKPVESILNDRKTSDLLVSLLRDLVCAHHFIYGDEVFYSEAEVYSKTKEQYLQDMMNMDKRELGGEPEILALNALLGIEIIALHTIEVGEGKKDPAAYVQKAAESQVIPVFLLFRPGHYDYAFLA